MSESAGTGVVALFSYLLNQQSRGVDDGTGSPALLLDQFSVIGMEWNR